MIRVWDGVYYDDELAQAVALDLIEDFGASDVELWRLGGKRGEPGWGGVVITYVHEDPPFKSHDFDWNAWWAERERTPVPLNVPRGE